jgi:hypothetical protein
MQLEGLGKFKNSLHREFIPKVMCARDTSEGNWTTCLLTLTLSPFNDVIQSHHCLTCSSREQK